MKRIKATIVVVYEDDLTADEATRLRDGIDESLEREVGQGMLTCGAPELLVDTYDITIEAAP